MKITALIVTYNRLEKLKSTVKATLALPFQYVVIVNNASTDETQAYLSGLNDPRICIITSETNSGGAGGFKKGAQWIIGNLDCEWILFYDDDAYPQADFYACALEARLCSEVVYCCGVSDRQGRECKMNLPWLRFPKGLVENIRYVFRPGEFVPQGNAAADVVTISFVGMLISRKQLASTLDYIHDELFIYFDDVYYGYHLTLSNIRITFNPLLKITHDIIQSNKRISAWKIYYLIRNLILNKKYFAQSAPFDNYYILLRLAKYLISCIRSAGASIYLKSFFRGIYDGIKGNTGKGY